MNTQKKTIILGILRHILTTVGGAAASGGYMSEDDTTTGVGAIMALVGIVLSILAKRRAQVTIPLPKAG